VKLRIRQRAAWFLGLDIVGRELRRRLAIRNEEEETV
jgi:hypothetical protein